jgi:alkanesulfonate monooxygenase SsuD/methylene tetrahydromethanopterin reductase-like flavin-dependent oxidoreductase (luciferase family)
VPFLESREIFDEALELIVKALRNERVSFRGERYHVRDYPMALRPMQRPNPPFWYATSNPEHAAYAGRRGMHLVGAGPASLVGRTANSFRAAWKEHHRGPDSINPQIEEPRVGAVRHCYIAPTEAEALATARPAYKVLYDNLQKLWRDFSTIETHFTDNLDVARKYEAAIIGSPETVAAEVAEFFERSGCNYLVLSFAWGGLTQDQAEHSLELFASRVMPRFDGGHGSGVRPRMESVPPDDTSV